MTFTTQESREARRELLELFEEYKTQTVFVVQRKVSRSGMTRWLDLYLIPHSDVIKPGRFEGQTSPRCITILTAKALRWPYDETRDCLKVGGCGMDMHFHTVYTLSMALYCPKHYDHDKAYYLKHRTI